MSRISVALLLVFVLGFVSAGDAYDPQTHREIAQRSASIERPLGQVSVDGFLKQELGLPDGLNTQFRGLTVGTGRTVDQLIGDGALAEDDPVTRSLNHFHNPLIDPWDDAGLRAFSIFGVSLVRGQSSVLWQQNSDQNGSFVFAVLPLPSGGSNWSWQDARRRYLAALTRPLASGTDTEPGRDLAFGELFENLGHLVHAVHDAFVPAHTRNDAHPPFVRPDWYEKWVEETRNDRTTTLFADLVNSTPKGPAPSIFTTTNNTRAPVPVARLIDTDTFTSLNSSVLGDTNTVIGAAEFTNGNFPSRGTLFRTFALPRAPGAGDIGPVLEESPGKFRRYFSKTQDGVSISRFVTEGMLFDSTVAAQAASIPSAAWMFDDRVHEDYARVLIPRAVGYSAALLDYFFRGRLDVDLVEDETDPSVLRLRGTNASIDPLVSGTLKLYADVSNPNPAGGPATIARTPVPALDDTTVADIAPGQTLISARFQAPEAERFVAVYQGQLGNEVPVPNINNPTLAFAGGVIGKVLGGVRVEEIFLNDVQRWVIRTPKQVVLLSDDGGPLTIDRYEDVKWGDGDDLLVARTAFGPGQPNRIVAYRVPRARALDPPDPERSDPLEMVATTTAEGVVAMVTPIPGGTVLPAGIGIGTTVTVDYSIAYQQQFLTYNAVNVYRFIGSQNIGFYEPDHVEYSALTVETQGVPTQSWNERLDLSLDPERYQRGAPTGTSYRWSFADLSVDANGHVLALVRMDLTAPPFALSERLTAEVRAYRSPQDGHLVRYRSCTDAFHCFDETAVVLREYPKLTVWALVDLTDRQTLASSSAPLVSFAGSQTVEAPDWAGALTVGPSPFVHRLGFQRREGGPNPTPQDEFVGASPLFRTVDDGRDVNATGSLTLALGRTDQLSGTLRSDLAGPLAAQGMLGTAPGVGGGGTGTDLFVSSNGLDSARISVNVSVASGSGPRTVTLVSAQRARPAVGAERLVLQAEGGTGTQKATALLVWDPAAGQARTAQFFTFAPGEFLGVDLDAVSSTTALVHAYGRGGGYLVGLDPTATSQFLVDPNALYGFRLLAPRFLYSPDTMRFHRVADGVPPTRLPLRLLDVAGGNPFGDYHAIRVP